MRHAGGQKMIQEANLRRYIVGGVPTLGLLGAALVVARAAPPAAAPMIVTKSRSAGRERAVLRDGSHKCLRAGQFCAPRKESVYRSRGYTRRAGRLRSG